MYESARFVTDELRHEADSSPFLREQTMLRPLPDISALDSLIEEEIINVMSERTTLNPEGEKMGTCG